MRFLATRARRPRPGGGAGRILAGTLLVAPLLAAAVVGPLLAGDRPVVARVDGRIAFPAAGRLPVVGGLFERPDFAARQWADLPRADVLLAAAVPHDPVAIAPRERYLAPGGAHPLGTDSLGRDVAARLVRGARVSVTVALLSTGTALVCALVIGSLAGYFAGWVDAALSRLIEVVLCFPTLFFVLVLLGVDPPLLRGLSDPVRISLVVGLTGWTAMARYLRAELLRLRASPLCDAARATGASDARIIAIHLLPNAMAPVIVAAAFFLAGAVLLEAAVSFLGFGVQPPEPSWGSMLGEAQEAVGRAWWLAVFPGGAIFLTVLGCNLIGEGLRAALDPRGRGPAL